jgi:L-2-hydroxyglutarate oxidase
MTRYDFIIIGGGIVGASTAWQLKRRHPKRRILLLEREETFGTHQTGHNSGVIHAGVYYEPGSLKARFCREGLRATLEFCREESIPVEQRGKLLVATSPLEMERMEALYRRCLDNGVSAELIGPDELRAREPGIRGDGAIFVPETGITSFGEVCHRMLERFQSLGGECRGGAEVTRIEESDRSVEVTTRHARYMGSFLVVCAGLMADRMVRLHGLDVDFRIVPFRGEFFRLPPARRSLVRHLIYPIPDPALPFVGVHLTPTVTGEVIVGPNAVPAWRRLPYGARGVRLKDAAATLGFPGFYRLLRRYWRAGVMELRSSLSKAFYLDLVRRYCPELGMDDLLPHPSGVRAQAVKRDGTLIHDFLFAETPRSLHVCNAPSPAATSAIPIGNYICERISER